jgi:hypothetical protein
MMANSDSSPSENLLQPTKEQNGQILSRSLGLEPNAQEFAPRHSKTTTKYIKHKMNTQRIPSLNTSSASGTNKKFFDMLQANPGLRIWIA